MSYSVRTNSALQIGRTICLIDFHSKTSFPQTVYSILSEIPKRERRVVACDVNKALNQEKCHNIGLEIDESYAIL